jgi:hypothetical protein
MLDAGSRHLRRNGDRAGGNVDRASNLDALWRALALGDI